MAHDYGLIVTNLTLATAAIRWGVGVGRGISADQIMKINNSMKPADFVICFLHHELIYLSQRLTWEHYCYSTHRSFATTVSQLKICDFSGETFKGFEVLKFSMNATTTQLLSSGEFCKLRYDTIPVESASANVSFYTNNSKMPNFEL